MPQFQHDQEHNGPGRLLSLTVSVTENYVRCCGEQDEKQLDNRPTSWEEKVSQKAEELSHHEAQLPSAASTGHMSFTQRFPGGLGVFLPKEDSQLCVEKRKPDHSEWTMGHDQQASSLWTLLAS